MPFVRRVTWRSAGRSIVSGSQPSLDLMYLPLCHAQKRVLEAKGYFPLDDVLTDSCYFWVPPRASMQGMSMNRPYFGVSAPVD